MKNIPISFYLDYSHYEEPVRRSLLHEFAVNGGKYIVLNERMVSTVLHDPEMMTIFQNELADEGLQFMDSHAPFGMNIDLNMPRTEELTALALRHKLHLHIAAMCNVKTMTVHVGNDARYSEVPLDKQIDNISRMLDILLPEAEACGVIICIENIWYRNNTPESLLKIKSGFDSDFLGFCYDSGHANIMNNGRLHANSRAHDGWRAVGEETPKWDDQILEKMLPHIVNCHLHDNDGAADQHDLPGNGCIDWQKTVDLLNQAPRLQVIQSEVISLRNRLAIKTVLDKFAQLFNRKY